MTVHEDGDRGKSPFLTLSSAHIADAVNHSPDNGVTLFLAKLGLYEIGSHEAEELATSAHLSHKEQERSLVERLALGHNHLTTLPWKFELFTRLRYLNLKHNLFSEFPNVLTQLPCLEILDISHNRIRSLPVYPVNLVRLRVLSLSRNKITTLPTYLYQFRNLEVLRVDRNPIEWPPRSVMEQLGDSESILNAKEWVANLQKWLEADGAKDKEYDDSGYSEQPDWEHERPYDSWQFPSKQAAFDAALTPHARSFSIDSISSIPDSPFLSDTEDQRPNPNKHWSNSNHNSELISQISQLSGNSSADTFLMPSPTSTKSTYDAASELEPMHLRTTSYASILRKPPSSVLPKKSLPDLRSVGQGIPSLPQFPDVGRGSEEQASLLSSGHGSDLMSALQPDQSRISDGRSYPFVAAERNSYFRRSPSALPADILPRPLSHLIETARGILFSMGQLHETLDRCAQHGAFERTAHKFKRALDPANMTMLYLIRSLDRFDDLGQSTLPSPAVCRALVECCRDTVTAYRKSLSHLITQVSHEPPPEARYSRWLVLEIHGITAEICAAWQSLAPEIEHLRPFISNSNFSRISMTGTPAAQHQELRPAVRLRSNDNGIVTAGRAGKARRHAGSFSSKDVEIGKELPSYDVIPNGSGRLAAHVLTPTLRTPKRQTTAPATSTPSNSYFPHIMTSPQLPRVDKAHLRQRSQGSLHDSPSLISPTASLESASGSRTFVNKDVRQPLQAAVEVAPIVWDHLEKVLSDVLIVDPDIRETLDNARFATINLTRNILELDDGGPGPDKRSLRQNAYTFLKMVLELSNILKAHGNPRSVTPSLRLNMVKLANSTREFANILDLPSISYTPRSNSPTFMPKYAAYSSSSYTLQDNQLGSSLSRASSAQPPYHGKQLTHSNYDGLQPILPLSIKASGSRRARAVRESSMDGTDPG